MGHPKRAVPMQNPTIQLLPAELQPLLSKFYRAQCSHMRIPAGAFCWVVSQGSIVAGLCLSPVTHGHWLTGLWVAPEVRGQGLAHRLVTQALQSVDTPVWLFCHPQLSGFYARLGFAAAAELPETLRARLQRYGRHKPLIALESQATGTTMTSPILKITTVCLLDEQGRILLVRKRNSAFFMLPGGKAEAGETPRMTVRRELNEELGLDLDEAELQWLGHFQAQAANEPGHWVEAQVFTGGLTGEPRVQAEIEEMAWLDLQAPDEHRLAPLLQERILPVLRERAAPAD